MRAGERIFVVGGLRCVAQHVAIPWIPCSNRTPEKTFYTEVTEFSEPINYRGNQNRLLLMITAGWSMEFVSLCDLRDLRVKVFFGILNARGTQPETHVSLSNPHPRRNG